MVVTIRDVAKRLNLSITTVSRALDGYPDVAEDTRRLVEETAHQMGYVPNQAARQLRRRRTDTIGYILPAERPSFFDPFFAEFVAGLGDEASARGFDLLVSTAPPDSPAEQRAYERLTQGRRVDGVVLNRIRLSDWRIQYLSQAGFPFVTNDHAENPYEYPSVEVDDKHWFKLLVDHLILLGHQRIAYIGATPGLRIQADRLAGYRQALEEAGLQKNSNYIKQGDLSAESGYLAAHQLLGLPEPPSAIACVDDMTAMGVLHAARDQGLTVGRDLAVVGFDGILGSEHSQPSLTTVNQPVYQIARRMVMILISLIDGKPLESPHIYIEPTLEIRYSSTGEMSL